MTGQNILLTSGASSIGWTLVSRLLKEEPQILQASLLTNRTPPKFGQQTIDLGFPQNHCLSGYYAGQH